MITTEQKDKILEVLIQCDAQGMLDGEIIAKNIGIDVRFVMLVLDYLVKYEHAEVQRAAQYKFNIWFSLEGHEFYRRGGFSFIESLANIQIEKLELELKSLKNEIEPVKYDSIMGTISALAAVLSLFKR